jgi:hypothetical protein
MPAIKTTRSSGKTSTTIEAGRLAMLLTACAVAVQTRIDPDLWGHLKFGLDLASSGRLTSIDAYSFAQDVPWINHEWLSELLFGLAYRAGGVLGLTLLKSAILGIAFLLMASWTNETKPEFRGWLLATCFVGLVPIAATVRPQLWTILGLALLGSMLSGRMSLGWVPLVFAAWANMHGGWIVGVGVTALWVAGRVLDLRALKPALPAFGALGASVAATLANPYGWGLWAFLLETVRLSRPDISEWRPYWEAVKPEYFVLWPLSAAVLVVALATQWRLLTWARLLPALWLMINGLFVRRLAPLGGILTLYCVAEAWSARTQPDLSGAAALNRPLARRVIDAITVAAIVVPMMASQSRCLALKDTWVPDVAAASALDDPNLRGRLVVPFDWGQFAIWHWGPRLRVSMDGRRETVYSQQTISRHGDMVAGRPEGLEYLARVSPEYVWMGGKPESPFGRWLLSHGYHVDVQTPRSFIATRGDLPPVKPGPPRASCFP